MASLGAVENRSPVLPQTTLIPISGYEIVVGRYLGELSTRDPQLARTTLKGPIADYVVRQLTTIYRQLWPSHGQRFPQ